MHVSRHIQKVFEDNNIICEIKDWGTVFIPVIKPLGGGNFEYGTWDFLLTVGTVAKSATTAFEINSHPTRSKKAIYYGVVEGLPMLQPHQKSVLNNRIITPSHFAKDMLEEYGIQVKAVIHHGIDHRELTVSENSIQAYRSNFKDRKILYFLGSMHTRKGIPNLVKAISHVKTSENFVCIIITENESVPTEYQKTMRLIHKYKLENKVLIQLKWGKQSYQDRAVQLNVCDLYVHPALCEGFGIPILEAMACKKPSVIVDAPPMNELVSKKEGYPVPYKYIQWEQFGDIMQFKEHVYSPVDFAQQSENALNNPKEMEEKAIKAYEKSLNYDYRKVYKKFLDLLD